MDNTNLVLVSCLRLRETHSTSAFSKSKLAMNESSWCGKEHFLDQIWLAETYQVGTYH